MRKLLLITLATAICLNFASCGGDKTPDGSSTSSTTKSDGDKNKDERLSAFMLGGVYFIRGYGGQGEVNNMITTDDKEEIIANYKELLEFPFKPSEGEDAKSTLSRQWEVNDKASLIKSLDELKAVDATKNSHKAWDYARLVNNACMGYAAGYLTKDEAEKRITEILPMARKDFKTWDDYIADFNAGRKAWGGDPEGDQAFDDLTKAMLTGDKSIYKLMPLN